MAPSSSSSLRHTVAPILAAALVLCGSVGAQSNPLSVAVDATGAYKVTVAGWGAGLVGGATGLDVNGTWLSSTAGQLTLAAPPAQEPGVDMWGPFNATVLTWKLASNGTSVLRTTFRTYANVPAIAFETTLLITVATGSKGTSAHDGVTTSFPAWTTAAPASPVGFMQWLGPFIDNGVFGITQRSLQLFVISILFQRSTQLDHMWTRQYSKRLLTSDVHCVAAPAWCVPLLLPHYTTGVNGPVFGTYGPSMKIASGLSGGPIVMFDSTGAHTLVLSAMSSFMSTSVALVGGELRCGVFGSALVLPAGFSTSSMLWYGTAGINPTIMAWGAGLLKYFNKAADGPQKDYTNTHLIYNTDHGACELGGGGGGYVYLTIQTMPLI